MPSSPITGFIKKKVAAKKFNRSARQLTRDITVAMELKDDKILQHLKLRTADGEVFDGGEVTTELVNKLHKREGRNPMWYLRRSWLEEAFGRRKTSDESAEQGTSEEPIAVPLPPPSPSATAEGDEVRQLMREAVTELRGERDFLKSQLEAKDEQLNEALQRDRESNVLLKNLQELMGNLQEGLLALPTASAASNKPPRSTIVESPVASRTKTTAEPSPVQKAKEVTPRMKQGSGRAKTIRRRPAKKPPVRQTKAKKTTRKRSATPKKVKQPSFTAKHLPTFSRLFSRSK